MKLLRYVTLATSQLHVVCGTPSSTELLLQCMCLYALYKFIVDYT